MRKIKEKSTPRRSTISRPVLEFSFKSLFNGVLPLLSCLVRDVLDEGVLNSINSNEKTALKLQVRASSPENYGPTF
jgi:hypothetical protein